MASNPIAVLGAGMASYARKVCHSSATTRMHTVAAIPDTSLTTVAFSGYVPDVVLRPPQIPRAYAAAQVTVAARSIVKRFNVVRDIGRRDSLSL
jgi:hypothetical protein